MHLLQHFKELTVRPKNAQELKGLILQLAVQGKLTRKWREDNPNLQNASSLLKQIQKEKELLIQDKKIKKEKPLTLIISDEIPYELPKEWIWCRLGQTGYTQTGNTPPTKDQNNFGNFIPFIGPAHISNKMMKYPEEGLSELGLSIGRLISQNSLMMVCIGGSIGKCNINEIAVTCNQQINTITPLSIPVLFVKSVCQSPYFQKFVIDKSSGSATPIINKGKWEMIPFPLPPLEEQKEIVEIVETLFKEVEQLEQLTVARINLKEKFVVSALSQLTTNNTKKEWGLLQEHFHTFFNEKNNIKKLRETFLQLAVQGKLTADWRANNPDFEYATVLLKRIQIEKAQLVKDKKIKKETPLPAISKEEIPYELPEGWVWANILDISLKVTDGEHATPIRIESGYKLLSARNVTNEGIRLHKVDYVGEEEFQRIRKRCDPQKGDVLISCSGSVGRVCLVDKDDEYCMVRSAALIKHHHENINGMFLCYSLRSPILQEQILEKSRSTAQSNLFLGKIKELIFPLPPLEEQKAIVEKVNTLMALCDALEKEVKQSQEQSEKLMQSVLREVFETGNVL
jgi:type I restriction enzyme S subunit